MIVRMLTHAAPSHVLNGSLHAEPAARVIIALEASELAKRLRVSGWVARAGRLSNSPRGRVWLVRFERPSTPVTGA